MVLVLLATEHLRPPMILKSWNYSWTSRTLPLGVYGLPYDDNFRHDYHHSLSLAHFLAYGLTVDGVVSSTKRVTCSDCRPIRYIWGKGLQRNAFKIGLNVIDISPKSSYSPKVLHVPWMNHHHHHSFVGDKRAQPPVLWLMIPRGTIPNRNRQSQSLTKLKSHHSSLS